MISVVEDLQPPPSKNPETGFDWARYDAPVEEWINVLIAWETGGQGPDSLDWYTWFLELSIDPIPSEVEELLQRKEAERNAKKEVNERYERLRDYLADDTGTGDCSYTT